MAYRNQKRTKKPVVLFWCVGNTKNALHGESKELGDHQQKLVAPSIHCTNNIFDEPK